MRILDTDLPPLGLGCWPLGGPFFVRTADGGQPLGYANAQDGESTRTIHAALDAGIRVFDVAAVYGAGHAERLLGAALKGRDDAFVITKIGIGFDEATKRLTGDETDPGEVLPAIDRCLRRLGRDCVDVVLLHLNELPVAQAEPLFDQLALAREAGKLRGFGWSTDLSASVTALAARDGFVAVEHAMNVFVDVPTMQATLERSGLTALIRSPLAMGVLTGKYGAASVFAADDIRSTEATWRDYFTDARVAPQFLAKLDAVRELLTTGGRSLSQGALCWLLAKSSNHLPLPGARTVPQVVDNAGALAHGPLPTAVMDEIEVVIGREPEGPGRPR